MSSSTKAYLGIFMATASCLIVGWVYRDGLAWSLNSWSRPEYSHAYFVPLISVYLAWQHRVALTLPSAGGSLAGFSLVLFGAFTIVAGELGTLFPVIGYGFIFFFWGVALVLFGWNGFKLLFPSLLILLFLVPLPSFFFNNLSAWLQLISSALGVAVVKLFGISVYLEGNVIDLGNYRLQVAEACSGLSYLFPLMTLGLLFTLVVKMPWWQRGVIFLSTLPITVAMNSFRIGMIGVLVEFYGIGMAEGFLHQFEGWVVFMAAISLMLMEYWVLQRLFPAPTRVAAEAGGEGASMNMKTSQSIDAGFSGLVLIAVVTCCLAFVPSFQGSRSSSLPERVPFSDFPMELGNWRGQPEALDPLYLEALNLDDYVLADYSDHQGDSINFYVAWYDNQTKGEAAHSPRTCLPGDGWKIDSFERGQHVSEFGHQDFNRVLISKGMDRRLIYYWFQQRDRVVVNEFSVKWYLFVDALFRNRTDGALVRLTATLNDGETPDQADMRLRSFLDSSASTLPRFLGIN